MKHLITYISVSILLIATSCTYQFELRSRDEKEKLYFSCMAGVQDTTIVSFFRAVRLDVAKDFQYLDDAVRNGSLTITHDGKPVTIRPDEKDTDCVPPHCFYFTGHLNPGEKLEMNAKVGDMAISSETTVPSPPANAEVIIGQRHPDISSWLELGIRVYDTPDKEDYYAAEFIRKEVSTNLVTGEINEYENITDLMDTEQTGDMNENSLMGLYIDEYMRRLYVFSDISASENHILELGGYVTCNDYIGNPDFEIKNMYRVIVHKISPELYRHFRAEYMIDNDELGGIGLRPPILSYSNIRDGLGIFGSMSSFTTDWTGYKHSEYNSTEKTAQ